MIAEDIKTVVSMRDVCEKYGFSPNRSGFICCPFQGEKTPSFKIYEKSFHCFGCGCHGDIFDFVSMICGCDFEAAEAKINDDFGLGLTKKRTLTSKRRMDRRISQLRQQREDKRIAEEAAEAEYWRIFDNWKMYDDNKRKYAPKSPNEEFHPLYAEALQNIDYAAYLLDMAEMKVR